MQLGRDPASITCLADFVEKGAFEAILQFYWERAIELRRARGELPVDADPPSEAA